MAGNERIAVVTGANRGIGFEVCRQLARSGFRVVLGARDAAKAAEAAETLRAEGLDVVPRQLDVTSDASVSDLASHLQGQSGRVAVLINNAGILLDGPRGLQSILDDQAESLLRETLETNLHGPQRLCRALVPLMKAGGSGRIVNVSSELGSLAGMAGGYQTYRVSKTALNAFTRILAAELKGTGILVNSACPGWVHTDMGGPQAPRTPEQGAASIVWLAALPDDGPTGGFFRDGKPLPW